MLGAGNLTLVLNSVDITQYCNTAELETVVAELEKTNFASTGNESDPGMPTHKITMGGLWAKALNTVIMPLVNSPTKTTAVLTAGSGASAVVHTWTNGAFVTNFKRKFGATAQSEWSGALNLSGAPTIS